MSFARVGLQLRLLLLRVSVRSGRRTRLAILQASWGSAPDRKRDLQELARSHASRLASSSTASVGLDNRTWSDLNLDDVFASIDRTHSTLGQHALYHRLRIAPMAPDLESFEALVCRMGTDQAMRERAQLALAPLQDPDGYDFSWLARPEGLEPLDRYLAFPLLTVTALISFALAPLWPWTLLTLLLNVAVRYLSDAKIIAVTRSIRQFAPVIAAAESLAFLRGDLFAPIVAPLQTDVLRLSRLKSISRWTNGNPFMLTLTANRLALISNDFVSVVYEYLNLVFLLDASGVYLCVKDLRAHRLALLRAVGAMGDVDAAISVASYRISRQDWTRPQFRQLGSSASLRDLRHPLVKAAVPNSIALNSGGGALITGSNMSGKSTFLRTVGVNVVLAQTLNTCLASHYEAPVFQVRSCIGRTDDLMAGKSYHLMEVEAIVGLVHASDAAEHHLFLLDELFRGTNAAERIAAGRATLEELIGAETTSKPHVVLAATHDGELVELLPRFDVYHFGDAVGPRGLVFDHTLRHGPANTRTAIALLAHHGAPQRLVNRALATARVLDQQRLDAQPQRSGTAATD